MKGVTGLILAFGMIASYGAIAQDCSELARSFSQEITRTRESSQIEQLQKANMCSATYSRATRDQREAMKVGVNILNWVGVDFGSSSGLRTFEERQFHYCEGRFGSYWSDQVREREVITYSSDVFKVVDTCLNSRAVRLTAVTFRDKAIVASITNGTRVRARINTVGQPERVNNNETAGA